MNPPFIALAAAASLSLAVVTGGLRMLAASAPPHPAAAVTAVVRNDLGQLKWVATQATDYTPLEKAGRAVYQRAHCSFCHTQYVRPVTAWSRPWGPLSADTRRWGPVTAPGEYAFDNPPLFGPGGIGPDLAREGLKYSDEWHLAHFYDPRMITKGSVMVSFSGLFDEPAGRVPISRTGTHAAALARTEVTAKYFDFASKQQVKLTPSAQGLLFIPLTARGKNPVVWTPNDEYGGSTVKLVAETQDIAALIAYVQKLGMNRGRWRELLDPQEIEGSRISLPRSQDWIDSGRQVYERRCIGCHGAKGDGNGPAATFLYKQRPRNFTLGEFKFRLTKGPLPTDADLLRTITRGVRGTAMPAWFELPIDDRLAVIQYIKYVLAADRSDPTKPDFYFLDEPPEAPMKIGTPPPPSAALISHGQRVWAQAKCWECHGLSGRGDGEKAAGLKDDWGFPIRPADLTSGRFKSGPAVTDIYRTISTGLSGTPMPSFRDAFPDADRWALAYYILSRSAFSDPLTGKTLPIAPRDRAALDSAQLSTQGPEEAYSLLGP
jgi:cytochrome c oxidase cbb3-type subunit 2